VSRNPPYGQDPSNGQSKTREFLEQFLERYMNTMTAPRSIHETIYGATAVPQESLFVAIKNEDEPPFQEHIGRAGHTPSGKNPNEYLWCLKADISSALSRLDKITRRALAYTYIFNYSAYTTAGILSIREAEVHLMVENGLSRAAAFLDG
jgi:hypothetical protein